MRILRKVLSFQADLAKQPGLRGRDLSLVDLAIVILVTAAALLVAAWGTWQLGHGLERRASANIWFQADIPRVFLNLTDASSDHSRAAAVHPIASILLSFPTWCLRALGISSNLATHLVIGSAAGLSMGLLFIFLRLLELPRIPAVAFVSMAISSAAFLHWSPVIELHAVSMFTILLSLIALAYGKTRYTIWWTLMNCATLGITITNWSFGIVATLVRWPLSRVITICTTAAVIVSILAIAQSVLFSNARPFFFGGSFYEYRWTQPVMRGGVDWSPTNSLRSLFVSTIVAPRPFVEIQKENTSVFSVVTNQKAGFFDRAPMGIAAAFVWLTLLAIGTWGGLRTHVLRPVWVGLTVMVASQAALHVLYGDPTFLYSSHFLPVLVAIASLSWFTPLRWIALGGVAVVTILGGMNNIEQFKAAARLAKVLIGDG